MDASGNGGEGGYNLEHTKSFVQQYPVTKSRAGSVSGRILAAFTVNSVAAKTKQHSPLR